MRARHRDEGAGAQSRRPRVIRRRTDGRDDAVLVFFRFDDLPVAMGEISRAYAELARKIQDEVPVGPERAEALWKLLESRDCVLRAIGFGK
jgi:hypothetical protein